MTICKKAWLLTLLFAAVFTLQLYAQFSGGSGTEANPYQVATAADLNNVRNYLSSHFIQIADIDLGVAPWNEGEGWVPIGDETNNFIGSFNGNDFVITGLYVNRIDIDYQGLFGVIHAANIVQVTLQNANVRGRYETGSLIGRGRVNSQVLNCSASAVVNGINAIGGLMGWAGIDGSYQGMIVSNCSFMGNVSGNDYIGGLIGSMNRSTVTNCYSSGVVEGLNHIGGLVGLKHYSTSSNCMSSCSVTGSTLVGGLIGNDFESNTTINCFSTGDVTGIDIVGGLVGSIEWYTGVTNCFSTGIVTGNTQCGGLIGRSIRDSGVSNSYWNSDITNLAWSAGGEGRTTAEMTYPYATNTYVGWDFDTVWHSDPAMLNGGYPYLNEDWLAPTANDLDAVLLSGDTTPMVNTATTYSISVKNRGSAAQSEYTVKLFGTGDIELGSVAGTPIAAGETLAFNINWTTSAEGPVTLYGKVILSGDENPFNDQTNQLQVNVLPPYTLYFNDFETAAGNEWNNTTISTAPNGGEKFLGRFANQTVTHSTNDIPPHNRITVEFDLYILDSWDADEVWNFSIDGNSIINTSFSTFNNQAYPDNLPASNPPASGVSLVTEFGWTSGSHWEDAVYHITKTIEHTGSSLLLSFAGSNLQGIDDESWGIDNILITYSDQPIPDFSVSEHSGQLPFTVDFTDTSQPGLAPITSWAWDFDSNGSIDSNLQNPSWTYTQPGNYDVTLTVGDGTNTVSGTKENIIHVENSTLADGLVGYYPFSGDAKDQSGWGNDGTAFNTILTEDRYGRADMAYYFDGTAWITIPQTFMMHQTGDAAFSMWLTRKDGNDRGIFWTRNDGSDANRFLFNTRYNGIDLEYRAPDGALHLYNGAADASFPVETWAHIVITRSGNTYKTYLNGVLVETEDDTSPNLPNFDGSWLLGHCPPAGYAFGNIDDVRLYDRALNPIEIQRLYAMDSQSIEPMCRFSATPTSGVRPLQVQFTDESVQGLSPITSWAWDLNGDGEIESTQQHPSYVYPRPGTYTITLTVSDGTYSNTLTKTDLINVSFYETTNMITDGLVGYWPFNGNTNDASGYGRDGTIVGNCLYAEDRYGNPQGAIANNGSPNFISVPYFPIGNDPVTISCWYKTNSSSTDDHNAILSFYDNTTEVDYRIFQSGTNIGIARHAPGYTWNETNTVPISMNTWYNVALVYDSGTLHFYLDGSLIQSIGSGYSGWAGAQTNYRIGCGGVNPETYTNGVYDDVAVFNRAFTSGEIADLYYCNTNPSTEFYGFSSPAINEQWLVGSYQNIEWVIPDTYTNITLEYSSDNGDTWAEIARSIPANQYSYNWMVPDTPSETCKIRIKDRATPVVLYESELFEICRPSGFEGMVAHFPLDANTNDSSGNANHGTNNGAVPTEDRFGSPNSAYSFDGNSYIHLNLQNGNMLDTSNTGAKTTVAFWMKWDGTDNMIVYGWYDFALWFYNGYFGFNSSNSDIYSIPSASFINNWVHVVAEFTNNSPYENELYINGVLQNLAMQNSYPLNVTIRNQARISGWLQNESYKFRGIVDDMYIFNRALNVDEVSDLYLGNLSILLAFIEPEATTSLITNSVQDIFWYADNAISTVDIEFSGDNGITWQMLADDLPAQQYHYNWTVPDTVASSCKLRLTANTGETVVRAFSIVNNTLDSGLVAYYPLDGNADDASGNGRHGTVSGLINSTNRFGEGDKSLKIDNKSDYISIPSVASTSISVSMWYRYEGTNGNWNTILCSANEHHSLILHPSNHQLGFWHHGFYPSSYLMQLNNWHHIVVVQSGVSYKLYVNNLLVLDSQGSFDNASTPLSMIGNYVRYWEDAQGSLGDLDDVRVYNRELNPSEIEDLYTNGASVSLSGHITGSNAPGTGLGGVQVTLGENLMSTDTDGNGNFFFAGVSANSQYRLRFSKDGYATQDVFISIPNYSFDLGTITLYENADIPTAVVASQVPAASSAEINWSEAARSALQAEASELGRAFISYSLYRLLVGEEQNPAAWTLVSTQSEPSYSDAAWYGVPFGVYKYAVANNYSNGYLGVPVFSNELQRRNYSYSENFDHGGATAPGWTVTHTGSTTHPWMPVLDSGSDYSYKVMNTNLSTANEILYSPPYDCSRYEKVSVSFWHNYVPNVNSQARFQYSTNGVTWTTLFTYTSTANSGIKTYDISSAAHHQAAVRFRWLYTATSYNTNSWTIDDFSVFGYTAIPVYLADPYPVINRKVNNQSVELGITYTDDDMVNASSLYYRIDANGNGEYDTAEDWIPITGYANASQIAVRVQAPYQTDGYNLRYEFKGADLSGGTVKYSGNSHLPGIADDYAVDIDTVLPTDVTGFSIDSASFHSVSLSWQPVTEEHFAAYEIYYDTHRGVGLDSNKWSVLQDAQLGNINTTSTTINTLNSGLNYWFRIRAVDLHGNVSELSELLLYVSADLPPVISNPLPSGQPLPAWTSTRTVNIGCTFADYYGIDPASVQYRFDRNGNGVYDTGETWQNLPARAGLAAALKAQTAAEQKQKSLDQMDEDELELYMRNRNLLQVSVPVTFETDGPELRFEFKASDVHGVGPVYTGFYKQAGIDDDWFVRIDTQNPTDIASIYIGVVNPNSIEVAWSRSSDQYFMTYEVYYATHPDVTIEDQIWDWTDDPVLAYTGGDIVVSNVIGLIDNTMYYFRVRAVDEAGNASPLSNEVNAFYGTASPPALPQNLIIQKIGDDVILSWDPVTEDTNGNPITVTGYNIYASDLPDVVPDIGYLIDASSTTSYNHIGIAPFVDKIFYIITAVVEEEVRHFDKPNDQRLRTKK